MIKKLAPMLVAVCCFVACDNSTTTNKDESVDTTAMEENIEEAEGEWISLFDGETLNGWHRYGGDSVGKAWKVTAGTLHLDTADAAYANGGGGDLVSDEAYDNFHLQLEWMVAVNGNSGIMFYVNEGEYDAPWKTGPEMQVLHNEGHPDGQIEKHQAGDLYDLISAEKQVANGPGEWNKVDIIANNGSLELKLNDVTTVKTTMWDENWKNLIANSKFADMEGFGTYKKGHIVLQDHDDNVWYRNIRIRRL